MMKTKEQSKTVLNVRTIFQGDIISLREIMLVFVICVLPIFIWSIIQVMREVPALILQMRFWELFGVIAYTQAFALLESLVITTIFIILGLILPARVFRKKFVAHSTMIVFITTIWAVVAHHLTHDVGLWSIKQFIPWLGVFTLSIGIGYLVVQRSQWMTGSIQSLVERFMVLSFIFVFISILSVFVIILRNI